MINKKIAKKKKLKRKQRLNKDNKDLITQTKRSHIEEDIKKCQQKRKRLMRLMIGGITFMIQQKGKAMLKRQLNSLKII